MWYQESMDKRLWLMLMRTSIQTECALEISGKVAERSPFTLSKWFIFYEKLMQNEYYYSPKHSDKGDIFV